MKFTVVLAFLGLFYSSLAYCYEENVLELSSDHKVYYRYEKPQEGQPTVVLLNGLIYAIENWDEYFEKLSAEGFGVLQIAYSTQPESLRFVKGSPYYSNMVWTFQGLKQEGLETQTLIDEVMAVVNKLNIKKFNLLSLSYGSIVASEMAVQQKKRIDNLILISPAVMSSHRYNSYGQGRHNFYLAQKSLGLPIDYYYDLELYTTMSSLITANKYSFENVSFTDFFNGVFQMARSSKWFDLKDYAEMDLPPTYLFLASLEEAPLSEDQHKFWDLMSGNPAKRSLVVFQGGYHALPGVSPEATVEMTKKALRNQLPNESKIKVGTGKPIGTLSSSSSGH
jgi:pimeloyl-ACP methyl ester carboxylesterase